VAVVTSLATAALSQDVAILVLCLGIVVGLVYFEVCGLSPGGVVSPGVLALVGIEEPLLLLSIAATGAAALFIPRWLRRVMFMFGRRELVAIIMVAATLQSTLMVALVELHPTENHVVALAVLVPGVLAYRFTTQPWVPTLLVVISAASAVAVVLLAGVVSGLVPDADTPGHVEDAGIMLAIAIVLTVPGTMVAVGRYRRGLAESPAA
jgi:gamma-polyglutamate biosynthesis protein CapC